MRVGDATHQYLLAIVVIYNLTIPSRLTTADTLAIPVASREMDFACKIVMYILLRL